MIKNDQNFFYSNAWVLSHGFVVHEYGTAYPRRDRLCINESADENADENTDKSTDENSDGQDCAPDKGITNCPFVTSVRKVEQPTSSNVRSQRNRLAATERLERLFARVRCVNVEDLVPGLDSNLG